MNKFDFDGAMLTEALRKTFENRGHIFTIEQFEQVMAFDSGDAMQKKWKAFCRKIDARTDGYSTVLKNIKIFLAQPFAVAIESEIESLSKNIAERENIIFVKMFNTLETIGRYRIMKNRNLVR